MKKTAKKADNESKTTEAEIVVATAPQLTSDFGREDLNAMRDLVNELARKVE